MKRLRMERARLRAEDARELACEPKQCEELDVEQVPTPLDDQLGGLIICQPIRTSIDSIRLPARSVEPWKVVNSAWPSCFPGRATSLENTGYLEIVECLVSKEKNWPEFSQNYWRGRAPMEIPNPAHPAGIPGPKARISRPRTVIRTLFKLEWLVDHVLIVPRQSLRA
jgi:hypothetical protein